MHKVKHKELGIAEIIAEMEHTLVVRFDDGNIVECEKSDFEEISSITAKVSNPQWDLPLKCINKLQAEAIESINNSWGVFTGSKIELLPHQLWVCKQVNSTFPTRWLIADDVGLGKTIEAGLILTPLIANQKINRLLIITPASLVDQWRARMYEMFDIRMKKFVTEVEDDIFWKGDNQIIASLHTLRGNEERIQRIIDSGYWDMVVIDEAHHLNADIQRGFTLSYTLIKKMLDAEILGSMIFFTGTPHRGKNFGFLSLLKLLKPDDFNPRRPLGEQLDKLKDIMIRNNKYNVTDLLGNKLFKRPEVKSITYEYSEQEQYFYELLSEFIINGQAYAATLSSQNSAAVMLVLISMQKLASSSVAAIRKAIKNRISKLRKHQQYIESNAQTSIVENYLNAEETLDGDRLAEIEEDMPSHMVLQLMKDEIKSLEALYSVSEEITEETKISKILDIIESDFEKKSVLLFTEYKTTQSLMLTALMERYGKDSAIFINGDNKLPNVIFPNGEVKDIRIERQEAAYRFNSGKVRFLIATEAAGEGIDLQENSHSMIHIDLPWNPMRLHQRIGRLNRYGQKHQVKVLNFMNPYTVESRIWEKLIEKLERISITFDNVMTDPEDIQQLVLGMTSPKEFRDLFAGAVKVKPDDVDTWFDQKAATFGGDDVAEVVKSLIGNVAKFDFKQISRLLPKVKLSDLQPFLELALHINGRRPEKRDKWITFNTPDAWLKSVAIRRKYEDMTFDRIKDREKILGVGNQVINIAIATTKTYEENIVAVPDKYIDESIVVYRLQDRVTLNNVKPNVIAGVTASGTLLFDWQLLLRLNKIPFNKEFFKKPYYPILSEIEESKKIIDSSDSILEDSLPELNLEFKVPYKEIIAFIYKTSRQS